MNRVSEALAILKENAEEITVIEKPKPARVKKTEQVKASKKSRLR
jgi:hypothetical protein